MFPYVQAAQFFFSADPETYYGLNQGEKDETCNHTPRENRYDTQQLCAEETEAAPEEQSVAGGIRLEFTLRE